MPIPLIVLIGIPILLGIAFVSPYDEPQKSDREVIPEEPDVSILYFILIGFWTLYLIKILVQIKKGTFKITQRY